MDGYVTGCADDGARMAELYVPEPRLAVGATVRGPAATVTDGPDGVRAVFTAGGLGTRTTHAARHGEPLVSARDITGGSWRIAAAAVWADVPDGDVGDHDQRPVHPHAVGLAVGSSWPGALLTGLSDRLGWEAVAGLAADSDPGNRLPGLSGAIRAELLEDPACAAVARGNDVQLLDGRCTAVPTVVITGDGVLRWGAGATWAAALQRALFGDAAVPNRAMSCEVELHSLAAELAIDGIEVVGVDLGTPTLGAAGITRLSAQLVARGDLAGEQLAGGDLGGDVGGDLDGS